MQTELQPGNTIVEGITSDVENLSQTTGSQPSSRSASYHDKSSLKKFLNKRCKKLLTDLKDEQSIQSCDSVSSTESDINHDLKVFVKKIDLQVAEKILEKFFSKFGEIKKAKIYRDTKVSHGFKLESKGCGWVKFAKESGVAKALAAEPSQLVLKNKMMIVVPFEKSKKVHVKTCANKQKDLVDLDIAIKHNQEAHVNNLPIDILTRIFSELCIRDLCIVEQVCKHWYDVAKTVWSSKKRLDLTEAKIFDGYMPPQNDNPYGFKKKPTFESNALWQILKKNFGNNMKYLNMSGYAKHFDKDLLKLAIEKCPNLICLNISSMTTLSNLCARQIGALTNLKDLNLSYMGQITDTTIGKIFSHCQVLESINLTFCVLITGRSFHKAPDSLRNLMIDQCENVEDQYLLALFDKNKSFQNLSMKGCAQVSAETLVYIINNLSHLESLNIAELGYSSLTSDQIAIADFQNLKKLRSLDLTNSYGDSDLVKKILATSPSLQYLNLSYSQRVSDEVFSISKISCPLEEINLSFVSQITDTTLRSLYQLSKTLKVVRLKGCTKLTNEGITDTMIQLSNLISLDVRNNFNVNNLLLEAALNLDSDRTILINCIDTSVNTIEFEFKYPDVEKKHLDFNHYVFKYKNLTFETNLTRNIQTGGALKIWRENGVLVGAEVSDSDTDEWDEFHQDCDRDFENYCDDDGEYFDDQVPEMFNELDEC